MKLHENLSFLIKHTPAAVAMFDKNMCYLAHSDRWLSDYQLGDIDIIGKSHYEVFPDVRASWKKDHQNVLNGSVIRKTEEEWEREDGEKFYLRYELRPWKDKKEKIGGLIMFTEVITPMVQARKSLERTVEELKETNADLEQFAYIASHDLKEPIRTIYGLIQILENNIKDNISDDDLNYISMIKSSSRTMINITESLLQFSRIGRVEEPKESINITELFSKEAKRLEHEKINISIPETDYYVSFQKNWLNHIVKNLVQNAIKYNLEPNKEITVSITQASKVSIIAIKDNGMGLQLEHTDKVFKMFQRLHNKEEIQGNGIGLALCKKIIEFNGGKIWYEPNIDKGTTFFFSIFSE